MLWPGEGIRRIISNRTVVSIEAASLLGPMASQYNRYRRKLSSNARLASINVLPTVARWIERSTISHAVVQTVSAESDMLTRDYLPDHWPLEMHGRPVTVWYHLAKHHKFSFTISHSY